MVLTFNQNCLLFKNRHISGLVLRIYYIVKVFHIRLIDLQCSFPPKSLRTKITSLFLVVNYSYNVYFQSVKVSVCTFFDSWLIWDKPPLRHLRANIWYFFGVFLKHFYDVFDLLVGAYSSGPMNLWSKASRM
jgi:hypothetical protein